MNNAVENENVTMPVSEKYMLTIREALVYPKMLQYLMGHNDIGVTLNTYTHLGLEDATDELRRMEDLENARKELFISYTTMGGFMLKYESSKNPQFLLRLTESICPVLAFLLHF